MKNARYRLGPDVGVARKVASVGSSGRHPAGRRAASDGRESAVPRIETFARMPPKASALPSFYEPQLATLVDEVR